jgi:hypothetical protein
MHILNNFAENGMKHRLVQALGLSIVTAAMVAVI